MNKDDMELFGILKDSSEFPKSNLVMKLVKVGFKESNICKKLSPFLLDTCHSFGSYSIPNCPSYILIWASTDIIFKSIKKDISNELNKFLKYAEKLELCEDLIEVKHKGQTLFTSKSMPIGFFMTYLVSDVYENQTKKISKLPDFVAAIGILLDDLETGREGKWSEGMSYNDFYKFLLIRVPNFKRQHHEIIGAAFE